MSEPRVSDIANTGLGAVSLETAYRVAITPQPDDFDELGHVNNAVYLKWAQEAATRHWANNAPEILRAQYVFVVLRHEVDYRDPILPGDPVLARTWLGAATGPRFERFVDIRKPDAAKSAARVRSVWCMVDIGSRRPRRVGRDILDAFQVPG